MNKLKKLTTCSVLITIFMIGMVSCMDPQIRADRIREEMLEHMRIKYGKEFIEISFIEFFDDNRSRLTCYPEGGNPDTDRARVMRERLGKNIYDDYFIILIRDEVEAEIEIICGQLSLNVKVFSIGRTYFDNEFDVTKSFADIRDYDHFVLNVRIAVLADQSFDMDGTSEQIFQALMDERFAGYYAIYYITEEGFHNLTRENRNDNLNSRSPHVLGHYGRSIWPPRSVDEEVHDANSP